MGFFERYLSVWVARCIGAGIFLGKLLPSAVHAVSTLEFAHVNIFGRAFNLGHDCSDELRIEFASLGKVRAQLKASV
ncbi:arsenical-resistance protein [Caballeronia arationis]|jgi:ACR3 family arsenite transporter|nr:arsenical-resistance protein [Caballeronia arationis]